MGGGSWGTRAEYQRYAGRYAAEPGRDEDGAQPGRGRNTAGTRTEHDRDAGGTRPGRGRSTGGTRASRGFRPAPDSAAGSGLTPRSGARRAPVSGPAQTEHGCGRPAAIRNGYGHRPGRSEPAPYIGSGRQDGCRTPTRVQQTAARALPPGGATGAGLRRASAGSEPVDRHRRGRNSRCLTPAQRATAGARGIDPGDGPVLDTDPTVRTDRCPGAAPCGTTRYNRCRAPARPCAGPVRGRQSGPGAGPAEHVGVGQQPG